MVDSGLAVGGGRAFVKREIRSVVPVECLFEDLVILPVVEDLFLQCGKLELVWQSLEHPS